MELVGYAKEQNAKELPTNLMYGDNAIAECDVEHAKKTLPSNPATSPIAKKKRKAPVVKEPIT